MARAKTVIDACISAAPAEAKRPLKAIRDMVRRVAPEAEEMRIVKLRLAAALDDD